jgi:hypothetical protein
MKWEAQRDAREPAMKPFRIGLAALIVLALSPVFPQPAQADVRSIRPTQSLPKPTNPSYQYFGVGVAIDGPHLIVLAINPGETSNTYAALLYRRNTSDGKWVFRRTLVTANGAFARSEVRMRNSLAAVQFGGQVSLFEYANGDYVPVRSAAPIVHPGGVAISSSRVLIGGNDCDYDGVVYEKGADGIWGITGRLDDNAGACDNYGLTVELNYNYALLRHQYADVATAWRRNGTAVDWVPAGTLLPPPDVGFSDQPYALQGATAVANNGYAYLRSGSSTWNLQGRATSVDNDNSWGITFEAVYRDGVLVTSESGRWTAFPRVYLETSPGRFEHLASLFTADSASDIDVSQRTVVSVVRDPYATRWDVEVFTLPAPLRAPAPIVNDFEDRDASDFDALSGQFQLATRGSNDVFAQNNPSGLSIALATPSDWNAYQRVEADIVPTFGGADSWVGLVARYADPNNYYFAAIRANQTFGVYKRVNGVNTLLRESTHNGTNLRGVALVVDGKQISLTIGGEYFFIATDGALARGSAGLATWQARADFDEVHVAGTSDYTLFWREWAPYGSQYDVDLTTLGGNWQIPTDEQGYTMGLSQLDKSGDARAYIGTPVANQEIHAQVRVDSFGTSPQAAWFGLLARYVDPNNHYYVTARSTGQIQIRKKVNGVISVLASADFTPVPGQGYELQFRVINDQLKLFVNRVLVASAHDGDIAQGQYGLATYRTAATWDWVSVFQP